MFMRGKPCRFGYKLWVLADSAGYPYTFQMYVGKEVRQESEKPLKSRVVLSLLQVVKHSEAHAIYFDNFFTSKALLIELRQLKFQATGTVRENRLEKYPFPDSKSFKKLPRGSFAWYLS